MLAKEGEPPAASGWLLTGMDLDLTVRNQGNTWIVQVNGEIDVYTAPRLDACLRDGLSAGYSHLIVDLQNCRYFDSEGIKTLLRTYHSAGEDGRITVCGATGSVERVLDLSGLSEVFGFAESVDDIGSRASS